MTDTIPLPPLCLTLLPPWPQAILHAGKRMENRSAGVSAQIGGYRGLVGLSQSKGFSSSYTATDADFDADHIEHACKLSEGSLYEHWKERFGKLFLVVNLVRIFRPHEARSNPWHVEGQHGLLFDKVYEVEPITCTGAVGGVAASLVHKMRTRICGRLEASRALLFVQDHLS
jgi:hypothetical protein